MAMKVKVMRSGNSEVVVLPASWRRAHNISVGDTLSAIDNPDGSISFIPDNEARTNRALERLDTLRAQTPESEFLKNLTPEQLKEELYGRR